MRWMFCVVYLLVLIGGFKGYKLSSLVLFPQVWSLAANIPNAYKRGRERVQES